jgi:hypothetical protein
MIYKGITFNVIQGIEPAVWRWSLSINETDLKKGQTKTKPSAVIAAWQAIDKALLEPKKRHVAAMVR